MAWRRSRVRIPYDPRKPEGLIEEKKRRSEINRISDRLYYFSKVLNTADDEEVSAFAGSMADSLIRLYEETGYMKISC